MACFFETAAVPAALPSANTIEPRFQLASTFELDSRPGASKTIYLDFDGHWTSGTLWRNGIGFDTPAYSLDADRTTFSNEERAAIQDIWSRVAEDFSPFDVNVSTRAPSDDDLRKTGPYDSYWGVRVVIGGAGAWANGAAGVAYVGSFNWDSDTPCFVFADQDWRDNRLLLSTVVSHEVGHTLGLRHDGYGTAPYYGGRGTGDVSWGPIMGNPGAVNLTQWSRGDYGNATNTEDDLLIITTRNGFGYRADDHGDAIGTATALGSGATVTQAGVIHSSTDIDFFSFDTTGIIEALIRPLETGANLDVHASILDASGMVIATSNPIDKINAMFLLDVAPGRYFLAIRGTGMGDPASTGYSSYGSIGQYSVVVNRGNTTPAVSVTTADSSAAEGNPANPGQFRLVRSGPTTSSLTVNLGFGGSATHGIDYAPIGSTVTFAAGSSDVIVNVSVIDDTAVEGSESVILNVLSGAGYEIGSPSTATLLIADDDVSVQAGIRYPSGAYRPGTLIPYSIVAFNGEPLIVTEIIVQDGMVVEGAFSQNPLIRFDSPGYKAVSVRARSARTGVACNDGNLIVSTIEISPSLPVISVTATDPDAAEGLPQNGARYTLTRSGSTASSLTVKVGLSGTAQPEVDYVLRASPFLVRIEDFTVTFLVGQSTVDVHLFALTDLVSEGPETVELEVLAGVGYEVASPGLATVSLSDGDVSGARIVDNTDPGFGLTGPAWKPWSGAGAYRGSARVAAGRLAANNVAVWELPNLARGRYLVMATWPARTTFSTNASFEAYDGSVREMSRRVNQRVNPRDVFAQGHWWGRLGTIDIGQHGGTLQVRLGNDSSGSVVADAIRVVAVPPASEMEVRGFSGRVIANGDITPSPRHDGTHFGFVDPAAGAITRTFSLMNTGTIPLRLTGTPVVNVSGPHATEFTVATSPPSTLIPFQESTFEIQFDPAATGLRQAFVSIASDDPDNSLFTFAIAGRGGFERIIDDRTDGFSATGRAWRYSQQLGLFDSDALVAPRTLQPHIATWEFSALETGRYVVMGAWRANPLHSPTVPYRIFDGLNQVLSVRANQRLSPNDESDGDYLWERLGTVSISSGSLRVTMTNAANGIVVADAIRIVKVDEAGSAASQLAVSRSQLFAILASYQDDLRVPNGKRARRLS